MIIKTKSVQSVRSQKTMNEEPSPEQILRLNSAPSLLTRRHLTESTLLLRTSLAAEQCYDGNTISRSNTEIKLHR